MNSISSTSSYTGESTCRELFLHYDKDRKDRYRKSIHGIILCLLLAYGCMQLSSSTVSLPLSAIQCFSAVEEIRDIAFEGEHIVWAATPGGL